MRPLGATMKGGIKTGLSTSNDGKQPLSSLQQVWKEWEIQLMVVLSFVIQVFLLLTGRLRRRNINGLLRVSIWLAYVGADFVAVYALGLFSQYEEKYRLGRHSFGDATPFLWVPFLLVHLGGQDSVTAFSLEDNNLWLRHLLNLIVQVTLAMCVFWKSIHRINSDVLIPAAFVFVAGIIKYGERTWALRSGSRDGLGKSSLKCHRDTEDTNNPNDAYSSRASYALQIVLFAQGLFVGRTMLQMSEAQQCFGKYFQTKGHVEEKLKVVMMEIGMMFDLLYTKAMVLQKRTGRIIRCASQISLVVAFVFFLKVERKDHDHNRVNTVISYTLFIGAIFMESCSVFMEIVSPWTRAHLKEGSFLHQLLISILQCRLMQWWLSSNYFIGQSNGADTYISHGSVSKVTCKVISALGLVKQWSNQRYHHRAEAQGIAKYFVEWFDTSPKERLKQKLLGRRLNYSLCLPFGHILYRLHIFTDLHISKHFEVLSAKSSLRDDVMLLKKQCEMLSNYMYYLNEAHPSMLPIETSVNDGKTGPIDKSKKTISRLKFLEEHAEGCVNPGEPESACPFEERAIESEDDFQESLKDIREMWTRLLVYAAGKCSAEVHARQLGRGGELITFVWLLMLHHGLGDAATEVKFLTSDDPGIAPPGSVVCHGIGNYGPRPEQPHYAFDFSRQRQRSRQPEASREGQLLQVARARTMQLVVPQFLAERITETGQEMIGDLMNLIQQFLPGDQDVTMSDAAEQDDEAATSDDEEETGDGTPREIDDEEVVVAAEVEQQQHQAPPED